jgi:hypothetical protein
MGSGGNSEIHGVQGSRWLPQGSVLPVRFYRGPLGRPARWKLRFARGGSQV